MAKVIKFDDTIEYKIDRANDLYADENFADALTLLFEVVKRDEKTRTRSFSSDGFTPI